MKTIFTEEEKERFINLTDSDLMIEAWESFPLDMQDEDIPFERIYVLYQELHLLKYGKYLEI